MKNSTASLTPKRYPGLTAALVLGAFALTAMSCSGGGGGAHAQSFNMCVNPQGSGGCFTTISAAVAAANPGDTIQVGAGTYAEMVTINKPLFLIGAGVASTFINASGQAHGIYVFGVTSGPTEIEEFTVENANREGVLVENSSQVTIEDNLVEDNDKALSQTGTCPNSGNCCPGAFPMDQDDCGEGLHLRGVTLSSVLDNTVTDNAGGILMTDETGPTSNNLIAHNTVSHNVPDCGITMPSHALCGAGSSDTAGCVGGPEIGKPAHGVFNNVVTQNASIGNGAAGVGMFTPTPGTAVYGNTVARNTIGNNAQGGVVFHSHAAGQTLGNTSITDNVIFGNGGDPDSEGGSSPAPVGIVVFSDGNAMTPGGQPAPAAPLVGINIAHNSIADESVDIFVGTKTATNVSVFLNNLVGTSSDQGVVNNGTGTVAAMQNYWGCATGPGTAGCTTVTGSVVVNPPLTAPYSN
jgi:parallel beta-helix repeat protein